MMDSITVIKNDGSAPTLRLPDPIFELRRKSRGSAAGQALQKRGARGRDGIIGAAYGDDGGRAGLAVDAEEAGKLGLEMEEGALIGGAGVEIAKGAEEEVEEFGDGMLGLGDQFDELDEIGGKLGAEVIGAEPEEGLDEDGLAQGVEIAAAAGGVADIVQEEEVELAGKGAARAAGALCGGLEAAMGLGEPGDNPTGIAKADTAQKDRWGAIHV